MRYVLGYVSVLVTILNEEEEIRYNIVRFDVNFKFKGLSCLLIQCSSHIDYKDRRVYRKDN